MRATFYLIITFLVGCGGSTQQLEAPISLPPDSAPPPTPSPPVAENPYVPQSREFIHASPEELSIDQAHLDLAFSLGSSQSSLHSLIVLKQNRLVFEAYFHGSSADELQHLRSITKTVTSAIVGIALDRGVLTSLDQTIGEFLTEDYPQLGSDKGDITLRHLLTMTSGFDWDETDGSLFVEWQNSEDPVAFLLNRPLSHEPGTAFRYNSASVHLLSVILDKATEGNLESFAIQAFFAPMDISQLQWERLRDNRFNGSAGLQLRSIDIAKIGQMLLSNGVFVNAEGESAQIIPESWVTAMQTSIGNLSGNIGQFNLTGYGYLWWLGQTNEKAFQLASGWGGQTLISYPDKVMLIVANTDWNVGAATAREQEEMVSSIIEETIFPSTD